MSLPRKREIFTWEEARMMGAEQARAYYFSQFCSDLPRSLLTRLPLTTHGPTLHEAEQNLRAELAAVAAQKGV